MDNEMEGVIKSIGEGTFVIDPITPHVSRWDILQKAFGTPWQAAASIAATIFIIVGSVFAWVQIVGPLPFAPLKSELNTKALAPSLEKPFRCSPEFPFKNNASKQVERECQQ